MKSKEKKLTIFNKLLISIIILLIIIILLFIDNINIINRKIKVIKEMSESTQISNLQTQINTLNASHEEYGKNIQTYKAKLAKAITEKGIETSDQDSLDKMASNIANITNTPSELYFPSIYCCAFPATYGSGGSSFRLQNLENYTKLVITESSINTAGVYIYGYSNNKSTTLYSSKTTISPQTIDITNYDGIAIYLNCYIDGSSIYGYLNNVYIKP